MSVLEITNTFTGFTSLTPSFIFINTNDTAAAVQAAGYLNGEAAMNNLIISEQKGVCTQAALVMTTSGPIWFAIQVTGTAPNLTYSLLPLSQTSQAFVGNVTATGSITAGTGLIATTGGVTATAGNIVAALGNISATAGSVSAGTSVSATTTVTAGTGITATTGNIVATTGGITATTGGVTAGSSGHAGVVSSFPATAARGHLALTGVANTGDTITTISNSAMAQASVISIPDPGTATANFVIAPTGQSLMKVVPAAAAGGGAVTQSITDAFCTAGSTVIGNWNTQTNAAQVLKIVPGNGSFVITSTADAGVGTFAYAIFK